jgi:anti-sigma B factor antagonist
MPRAKVPGFAVPGFAIDDELLETGTRVLTVRGDLDMATGPVLGQRIRRPLFWSDVTKLVVDLSDVGFIDSSGTRALVLSYAHAQALERTVAFVCPDGSVLRRLQAYGLDVRLPMHKTREEALSA